MDTTVVSYGAWFVVLAGACAALYYKSSTSSAAVAMSGLCPTAARCRRQPHQVCRHAARAAARSCAPATTTTAMRACAFADEFKKFQQLYLVVYLIMIMADWL